jgi:hypothetical protein
VCAAGKKSVDVDEYDRRGTPEEVTLKDDKSLAVAVTGEVMDVKAATLRVAQAAPPEIDDAEAGPALRARVRRKDRATEFAAAGFMETDGNSSMPRISYST